MSPILAVGSIVGFIVVAGLIWFLLKGKGAEDAADDQATGQQQAAAGETPGPDAGTPDGGTDASGGDDSGGDVASPAPDSSTNETPASSTTEAPKERRAWWDVEPFDVSGIPADKSEAIQAHIETLRDLDATVELSRARDAILEMRRESIPLLINALIAVDKADKEDTMRGWQIIQVLQDVALRPRRPQFDAFFRIIEWHDPTTGAGKDDLDGRRKAVKDWRAWWAKNQATWSPDEEEE